MSNTSQSFTVKYGVTVAAESYIEAEKKASEILEKALGPEAFKALRAKADYYAISLR